MNVLKRCCYRSLKENPKRTAVTIVGIVMAAALITAVGCMVVSFRASMIAYEKEKSGDFHCHFEGVEQENLKLFKGNQYVESYGLAQKLGYAVLEGCRNADKPYLYITALDGQAMELLPLHLTEGRMPENASELVIGRHVRSNGSVAVEVGDTLELELGRRVSDGYELNQDVQYLGGEETLQPLALRRYTVVGIIERPNLNMEYSVAPGYSAFTFLEEPGQAEKADVYVKFTDQGLGRMSQVMGGILGVSGDLYERFAEGGECTEEERQQILQRAERVERNYWLLKWELLLFSSSTMNMLYGMAATAVFIIIVTSVFCIRNSFVISLTEKIKLYGRLASVGTTSAQQRKIVYYEASFLSMTGIPLGIGCGIAATVILVEAVGGLVENALGFSLIFAVSVPVILLAAALSVVTVFLSAAKSARRAGRLSPVSAVRGNDTVKIRPGELRCPAVLDRVFGIGGRIAYKNLRRARVKYRTTVVSIVVSVAVFIGMSSFMELMFFASGIYYKNFPYQLRVSIYEWENVEAAERIAVMEEVVESEIVRSAEFDTEETQIPYTEDFLEWIGGTGSAPGGTIRLKSLGEEAYKRYCQRAGVDQKEAEDKAFVIAHYGYKSKMDGKIYTGEGDRAKFRPGDIIRGTGQFSGIEIEVLTQTDLTPMYMASLPDNGIYLIVSDKWMDSQPVLRKYDNVDVYVKCVDADALEKRVRDELELLHFTVTNFDEQYRAERSMHLAAAIFLYGFIFVVALIGITNIFNTITTNMELRAPEFAMLCSVGMTGAEFRRMIWLEGMFYGGKALLLGIPLGMAISLCFHRALGGGIVTEFIVPWKAVGVSILAVAALLYSIMRYSLSKIRGKNIMETIRSENI